MREDEESESLEFESEWIHRSISQDRNPHPTQHPRSIPQLAIGKVTGRTVQPAESRRIRFNFYLQINRITWQDGWVKESKNIKS